MAVDWDAAVLAPCAKVFGEKFTFTATVSNPAADPFPVTGVFDEAYKEVDLAGGTGTVTQMPVLGVQLSLFGVMPKQGDHATRQKDGSPYIVREVQPDGHGNLKLLMNYIGD